MNKVLDKIITICLGRDQNEELNLTIPQTRIKTMVIHTRESG